MKFIQLDENNEYLRDIPSGIPVRWDDSHFCSVESLIFDGYGETFKIRQITPTESPAYNVRTQFCERIGAEFVDTAWVYKWVITDKAPEQIEAYDLAQAAEARNIAKIARQEAVDNIKVTTSTNKTFDGDEVSQGRMARAIIALQATGTPSTIWVLADNSPTQATLAELSEALALAGAAQAAIWVIE